MCGTWLSRDVSCSYYLITQTINIHDKEWRPVWYRIKIYRVTQKQLCMKEKFGFSINTQHNGLKFTSEYCKSVSQLVKISCKNIVRLTRYERLPEAPRFSKCTMGIYTVKEISCGSNTSTLQHIKVTMLTTQMTVDNVMKST